MLPSQNKRRPNRSCLSDMYQNTTSVKRPAVFQAVISLVANHHGHKSKARDQHYTSTSCRPPLHPIPSPPSFLLLGSKRKKVEKSQIKGKTSAILAHATHTPPNSLSSPSTFYPSRVHQPRQKSRVASSIFPRRPPLAEPDTHLQPEIMGLPQGRVVD